MTPLLKAALCLIVASLLLDMAGARMLSTLALGIAALLAFVELFRPGD